MQSFFTDARIQAFKQYAALRGLDGPLRLFAGGNLIGAKGVTLAFHALARVKAKGVKFHYRLGGGGPESQHLRALAAHLGLQDEVVFGESLAGEAYPKELGATHIYLLPRLREGAPLTLMEAMLAGCVPVVAKCGGVAHVITDDCGYEVPITTRNKFVGALADAILGLDRDRDIIRKKGAAATQRIATLCTEEHYRNVVNAVYLSVTKRANEQN